MHTNRAFINKALNLLVFPSLIYFSGFVALTYPLITHFPDTFMASSEDAYQNTWSLWQFKQAVDQSGIDLWHTTALHYPQGISLYGHALSPLNGAIAYPLQKIMPWHQTYNSLVIFNFVLSGLSLFSLAYYYTKSWFPSLVAGGLFTFSTYHFQHSAGHLEMASMQWLAFFLLSLAWLLDSPTWKKAMVAAFLLAFTLWNTPYYFLYAVIAGIILVIGYLLHYRNQSSQIKSLFKIFSVTELEKLRRSFVN